MKQKERVLNWLTLYGTLTPMDAWSELGCYRLSDAILKLRKDGWDIETQKAEAKNKFDENVRFARYVFNGKKSEY